MSQPARPSPRAAAGRLLARFAPVLLVAVLAVAVYASGVLHHLDLDDLRASRRLLEAQVAAYPVRSALIFVALFAAGVTLCLPVVLVLSLAAGFLFGVVEGGLLAAAGSTLGGALIFLACRTAFGDLIRRFAGPRLLKFQAGAQEGAFSLVLSLRLVPVIPFWLINIGAAFVGAPLWAFVAATALGVIPSSIIYAALGAGLGRLFDAGERPSMAMLMQPHVIIPLAALAVLGAAPVAYRWRRGRRSLR